MRLDHVLEGIDAVETVGDQSVDVTSITHDSRRAAAGSLYCCIPGRHADGHDFVADAVGRGAVAVMGERPVAVDVPQVVVPGTRKVIGPVSAALFDHPARAMHMTGVTGTNGKSTTTHLLRSIFEAHGWKALAFGNLASDHSSGGPGNTPEAPDLQARLAAARDDGCQAIAMEVSSNGLADHRVDGIVFQVAVFTNLTRDHLEDHGTMEAYFAAKARLFTPELAHAAVVNGDDPWGLRLLADASIPMTTFAMVDAEDLEVGMTASEFRWAGLRVRLPLGGTYHVANALAAATAARQLDIPAAVIVEGLAAATPVPGRFEQVDVGQGFTVVVDYAHTPDALAQVLTAARRVGTGRVIAVFGCGGDRDRGKRPLMAQVAVDGADEVVVTSDNPRSEDPGVIIGEILSGIPDRTEGVVVEPDRAAAIALALDRARPGDVVVIAGKGHETGQIFADRTEPFDDRDVASRALTGGRL
ncbi:MAG TPA: UDP-N-acetylmuramoyl-L-alanyl-D-glutamate--2,6-diaminopimelate ligase [Acidimicrobiales bacterium]|nr:UDP-N-acetylmuramoyl-L-alanyl-D-glutamate--2,6-diaminopimelate ligase [Acidimicrobiales bacterium]